jgi:DNA polymerase-3 subunit gamma/tau
MTFYRAYRPRKISDLDLESVAKQGLGKLLEGQTLAHAYLFTGPRGSGKTSAARILAKLVNCQQNTTAMEGKGTLQEPCLDCDSCQAVESGNALDVIEIDAASNRGIDAIRELKDKIGLAPVSGQRKVYIIDEVHMLTTEAFNALLKTLEEPPGHAMFILCTTESHKVPETINSRCRRVAFSKATPEEVKKSLQKAVAGEKLEVEPGALERLAAAVDGSFREGHKLLEQLSQAEGGKITVEAVEELLGLAFVQKPEDLAIAIALGQTQEALKMITDLDKQGSNWTSMVVEMLKFYQAELEARFGLGEPTSQLTVEQLRQASELVNQAGMQMRTSLVPSLPLELAVIGLDTQNKPESSATNRAGPVKKNFEKAAAQIKTAPEPSAETESHKTRPVEPAVQGNETQDLKLSLATVEEKWPEVIAVCGPKNHSVAGLLRSSRPREIQGRDLVLEVFYKFHKEQLEQESKLLVLEEAIGQVIGPLRIRCVLGERTARTLALNPEDDNIDIPQAEEVSVTAVEEIFGVSAS